MFFSSPTKIGAVVAATALAAVVALNSFTIVQAGTVKVQSLTGKVVGQPLTEGLHFVNPLKSFDTISVRNDTYEVNGLNIPTQDRFNSTGNVTVLYNIDGSLGNAIKTTYGTAAQYIDKTLRQQLRSIVRDEGRKLEDSRALAQSENVTNMQVNIRTRLLDALGGTGISVNDVLIQDIEFDPRIASQILKTQARIEHEEAQKSKKRISETNAAIAKNEALGKGNRVREAADAAAYDIDKRAKADKQATIDRAAGKAEGLKLIAAANIKLSKTLTPEILEKQRLDNEAILYSKSVGAVPTTIIGDTDLRAIGVPVAAH